jgi:hypothetical protein
MSVGIFFFLVAIFFNVENAANVCHTVFCFSAGRDSPKTKKIFYKPNNNNQNFNKVTQEWTKIE